MNLMFAIIFLVLGILGISICIRNTGVFFNFGTIFCLLWAITGVLSNSRIYGFYVPSGLVNICMVIGIIIVGLGYAIKPICEKVDADSVLNMETTIKSKALFWSNILAFIFMIPFFKGSLAIIMSRGFAYLRAVNFSDMTVTGRSTIINLILQDICFPLFFVTMILSLIQLFTYKRGAVKLFLMSIANIFVYEIINGARNGFIIIIVILLFTFLKVMYPLIKDGIHISKRVKRIVIIAIIVMAFVVVYITRDRSLGGKSLLETFYYYYFAGPAYLSELLKNLDEYKLNNNFFVGTGTFGFVYNIIVTVLNFVGIRIFNSGHVLNSVLSNQYFNVSSSAKINAMATMYFPFLMDYGYFGIVLGPLMLVIASRYITKKAINKNNIRWYSISIFWMFVIYRTIFKWELIAMSSFFILFFIFLFTTKATGTTDSD